VKEELAVWRLLASWACLGVVLCSAALSRVAPAVSDGDASKRACSEEQGLHACLIVTDRGRELLTRWEEGFSSLEIESIEEAERGVFITAIVLFEGCQANEDGLCDASVDYVAYKPDGSVYGEVRNQELWIDKPPPSAGYSQLSLAYMGLRIEAGDPAGEYAVRARAKDRVAGRSVEVWRLFKVTSLPTSPNAVPD